MNGGFVEAVSKCLVVILVEFFLFVGIRILRLAVVCELGLLVIGGLWAFFFIQMVPGAFENN